MSHGFDAATAAPEARGAEEPRLPGLLGAFDRGMRLLNKVILAVGGLCLVAWEDLRQRRAAMGQA